MKIQAFRYFDAVARHLQFTSAAEELCISQPTLSNAIKRLEDKIEMKLIERSTKRLALTDYGRIFHHHIRVILSQFDNVLEELNNIKLLGDSQLHLGMVESFGYWVPEMISQFKKTFPNVGIQIREIGPNEIKQALINRDIDLGITTVKEPIDEINYIPFIHENLALVVPKNHKLSDLDSIDITAIRGEDLIHSLSGFDIRETIMSACQIAGFKPRIKYEVNSLHASCHLVEKGVGVSVIPESYLDFTTTEKVSLIPFKDNTLKRSIYLMYDSKRYYPDTFYTLIETIQSLLKHI